MIGETGERKSAVATPDGKSRKKKYMAVKYCNTFATPRLTMRFDIMDFEHCVITREDCIQFVVVVHTVLMSG